MPNTRNSHLPIHSHLRIHNVAHAQQAFAAASHVGRAIVLVSPVEVIAVHGSHWFLSLCQSTAQTCPDVSWSCIADCGSAAGHALAALHAGYQGVYIDPTICPAETVRRLEDIASQSGQWVLTDLPDMLDLVDPAASDRVLSFLTAGHL